MTALDDGADDPLRLWLGIVSAVDAVQSDVADVLKYSDVTLSAVPVLEYLMTAPDHRAAMTDVATALRIRPVAMTKLADRLGRRGLIDRRQFADDPLRISAVLTPEGLRQGERAGQLLRLAIDNLLQQPTVSREELRAAADILHRLAELTP